MRAIGASNNAIRRVIIVEGLVIGLISWALGAMIALPMGRLLSDNVGATIMRIPPRFIFAWDGLWLWLGVALVVAVAASLGPAWRASRLTVREILAYE
jgi:putative ABC transport system permease protein